MCVKEFCEVCAGVFGGGGASQANGSDCWLLDLTAAADITAISSIPKSAFECVLWGAQERIKHWLLEIHAADSSCHNQQPFTHITSTPQG